MASLHHLELMVKDGARFMQRISRQYSLALHATRETDAACQWVLRTGSATFLITQPKHAPLRDAFHADHPGLHLQSGKFHRGVDTFFDVAVRVKNVDTVLRNVAALGGGQILLPKTRMTDSRGYCDRAVIRSCVGNVVHTLIDRENYDGAFLPGFEEVGISEDSRRTDGGIEHVDHITLVCQRGNVDNVLSWYEKVFGFSRFFMNRWVNI